MIKLLEKAIENIRSLPDNQQSDLAELLMTLTGAQSENYVLSDDERKALELGLKQADEGDFVADNDMAAFWSRPKTA